MMAFPDILLAIALVAALGPSLVTVIVALGIVYTPRLARIVRASTLVIRELPYVEAARALGVPTWRIMSRHVLRNLVSPILVQGTFIFAYAMLAEAGLSCEVVYSSGRDLDVLPEGASKGHAAAFLARRHGMCRVIGCGDSENDASLLRRDFLGVVVHNALPELKRLITKYGVIGKQVHDARIVAMMLTWQLNRILTLNDRDFRRYAPEGIVVAPTASVIGP